MDTQHIGPQIRKVRKSLKITQKQLATMSGLHLKTITNLEKGNTINPKVDTISRICKSLSISLDELLKV